MAIVRRYAYTTEVPMGEWQSTCATQKSSEVQVVEFQESKCGHVVARNYVLAFLCLCLSLYLDIYLLSIRPSDKLPNLVSVMTLIYLYIAQLVQLHKIIELRNVVVVVYLS